MKVHQPNLPAPEFSTSRCPRRKYADSVVELDTRIGRIMDKLRALGLDKNTLVFYTTDNGAWQDVYPDAGYTPFRGTKGTVREGGNRVPAIAWWPGKIKAGSKNHDIVGGLDLMATFAAVAGVEAAGEGSRRPADHLRQLRHVAGPVRHRQVARARPGSISPRTNCRPAPRASATTRPCSTCAATTAQPTGGLAVDTNLGWKGAEKYVATVPQVFDLWQDPQERYDIFMNNFTERTWTAGDRSTRHQEADEDLRQVSAAQAAERGLHRPDHDLEVRAVPVGPRAIGEEQYVVVYVLDGWSC